MSYLEIAKMVIAEQAARAAARGSGYEINETNEERGEQASDEAVWAPQSEAAAMRFDGQSHTRLFVLIGCKVRTPGGPGTLLQVFADRVVVLLDSERDGACARFPPTEVSPIAPQATSAE
jgi:hypothetical protein